MMPKASREARHQLRPTAPTVGDRDGAAAMRPVTRGRVTACGDACRLGTDVPNVLRACCSMLHSHKGYHRTAFIGRDHDHEAPFPDDSFGFEHSKGVPLLIPATGRQLLLLSQSRLKMTCSLH